MVAAFSLLDPTSHLLVMILWEAVRRVIAKSIDWAWDRCGSQKG
jgi:hypothetical protein